MLESPELELIRRDIDAVDREIVALLVKRFKLVGKIPDVKQKLKIPTVDPEREEKILMNVSELAEGMGMDGRFMRGIFRSIIDSCTKFEESILERGKV